MSEVILYTHPMSRGRIVRWLLEESGVPYRTEFIHYGKEMKAAPYLAINPMGKVPAIRHGKTIVTECAAICAYLADAFPEARLAPPSGDRGLYYRWLFFAAGPLEMTVFTRAMGIDIPEDKQRSASCGAYSDVMNTLERAVSDNRYVAGDQFTAADVYVCAHLAWGMQFATIEKRQPFLDYVERLQERPAFQRARAIDDAALKELEAS